MGKDLRLFVLNEKEFVSFDIQRRSEIWSEITELPTENLPSDFHKYDAFEYRRPGTKKGSGRYKKNNIEYMKQREVKLFNWSGNSSKKEQLMDCYGDDTKIVLFWH